MDKNNKLDPCRAPDGLGLRSANNPCSCPGAIIGGTKVCYDNSLKDGIWCHCWCHAHDYWIGRIISENNSKC